MAGPTMPCAAVGQTAVPAPVVHRTSGQAPAGRAVQRSRPPPPSHRKQVAAASIARMLAGQQARWQVAGRSRCNALRARRKSRPDNRYREHAIRSPRTMRRPLEALRPPGRSRSAAWSEKRVRAASKATGADARRSERPCSENFPERVSSEVLSHLAVPSPQPATPTPSK